MGHEDTGILVGPVNLRGLAVMTRIVGFVFAAKKNTIQNKNPCRNIASPLRMSYDER